MATTPQQRIQIKRRDSAPASAEGWAYLLDGELGYIKDENGLYIGLGSGNSAVKVNVTSWGQLEDKPTSILSQIYLNSTDPTKIVYKKVGSNTEHTLGNFAPLTNGLIDLKYLPQGALERLVVVANATARLKLTTANVQLGDTVKETDTGLMYIVVDESKLNSEDGYQVYVAGRAAAVDWTGVENKVNATASSAGLMSAADKKKLDNTNVAYGTCSTAASTTQKDIVITSQGNWSLQTGSIIVVKFTYTNTAQNPVFKVGNAAAKSVWYNTALISTSNLSYAGYKDRPSMYMYDGTQFVWLGWTVDSNSDTKVTQTAAITTAGEYPVLLGYSTATTAVTNTVNKAAAFTYNPNTKILTAETFKGKLTGNADTATKLQTARTISLTGDATGSVSFDGSENASITVTVADDSHNHTISNIDDLQSNLDLKYDKAGGPISGHIYMTGSNASSSTANTTQLIFGTSSAQHVAVTSNDKALVINPNSSATTNQIVLYLNQQSVFPGGIKISAGNLDVSGASTLTGAVTAKSTLTVTSGITGNSTLTINGATTLKSTLAVTGTSTLTGAVTTGSTLAVGTNLTVNRTSTLKGGVTANSTLQVDGASTLKGAVTMNSTLQVDGKSTLKGDVDAKKTIKIGDGVTLQYNSTNKSLEFVFS